MSEENNENMNQLYLNYDLRTNYLYEAEVKSLKEFSTLRAVVHSFECEEALEEMRSLFFDQSQYNTNTLFTIVENNLQIHKLPITLHKKVKLTIRLVYDEIIRFLEMIIIETDRPLFLGNFVFNWQGVINPRETFLQALERNVFSPQERFEFSCKFLFDEDKIFTYFNNLTQDVQNYYRNNANHQDLGLYGFVIFYWVMRFIEPPVEIPRIYLLVLGNNYSNFTYFVPNFCSEIGVQYLFENTAPNFASHYLIHGYITFMPSIPVINIFIYLLFQLREDELFNTYCSTILIELVDNSRWHDNFIKYFKLLKNHVEINEYINLTYTVVMKIGFMAKIEGKIGKYFNILQDFIIDIPIEAKTYMKDNYEEIYVMVVFDLFTFHDIKLIYYSLSNENENHANIGNTFYKLATTYFGLFTLAYHECLTNIKKFLREIKSEDKADFQCSIIIERFIRNLIQSEYHAIHLLTRLKFTPSDPHRVVELTNSFGDVTQPFIEWFLNLCIITEESRRKWQYFFLENGEFVNLITMLLIKVEYPENFLSIIVQGNKLLILYKRRIVLKMICINHKIGLCNRFSTEMNKILYA